ncbi:uncharacterized protein LOC129719904 [Wyeomyia smithii]|uniref:uncharacterized protein LOC129719904 n=1 Tax=Wyeomyia smithii TaxID=174621 RepID=UPI002467C1A3|nr:uncharacterized protein LOC129719904 [Wyeomyia smithii]
MAVAAPQFDAKLAASILTPYDGDSEKLSAFVDGIKFLKTVIAEEHHRTLKLFLMTRISGKARDALPNDNVDRIIDQIIELIKSSCESKVTSEQLIAKINAIKHGSSKEQYCREVENLCDKLTNTYVREYIPHETAKKLATKAGVDKLIKLAPTNNEKIVLQAGTFKTIEQATQKFNELPDDSEIAEKPNRIFNVSHQRDYYQNRRGNWRGGKNDNRNNFSSRGFHYNNQRFMRFNKQQSFNGNYRGARGNTRGHWHHDRQINRIYFADNQESNQNASVNAAQYAQDLGQQGMFSQSQTFLGAVGQYTR